MPPIGSPVVDREEWRDIIVADPFALPEQTPEWVDAICASGRYRDASRVYRLDDGRRFVLPLVRRTGPVGLGGQLWSFPPAWGIGGPVGAGLDSGVVSAIVDDLQRLRAVRVGLRSDPMSQGCWDHIAGRGIATIPRRVHVLELHSDLDRMLAGMNKATRREIRQAAERGVEIDVGHAGRLLETHYALYLTSVERWAHRQHEPLALARARAKRRDPLSKLQAMARSLGERFVVVIGSVNGQPAASTIILLGATTRDTRGAADLDVTRRSGATSAVQWAAIQTAVAFGAVRYNMGESGYAEGLSSFKERFGAVGVPYSEYRIERLPLTRADTALRTVVKRAIRFKDT